MKTIISHICLISSLFPIFSSSLPIPKKRYIQSAVEYMLPAGIGVGGGVGATLGLPFGPPGVAAGYAAGVTAGAAVGVGLGTAVGGSRWGMSDLALLRQPKADPELD